MLLGFLYLSSSFFAFILGAVTEIKILRYNSIA